MMMDTSTNQVKFKDIKFFLSWIFVEIAGRLIIFGIGILLAILGLIAPKKTIDFYMNCGMMVRQNDIMKCLLDGEC